MASLKDHVEKALNESRILVLGTQVFVGAQFFAVFAGSFGKLPRLSQYLAVGTLVPLLLALALFMAPAPYHQLVERGASTQRFQRFITRVISLALGPFAVALGLDLYIATTRMTGPAGGLAAGVLTAGVALFFWYGLEILDRPQHRHPLPGGDGGGAAAGTGGAAVAPGDGGKADDTDIAEKVKNVLTEARVVLPGVQALLGFQFDAVLTDAFDKLPPSSQYLHLASLALLAAGMILLIAPAAYHRLVERGEDSEHFHRFASRMVLAAMVPLALGVSGDFFVVVRKVAGSAPVAGVAAGLLLAGFLGLWFGFTLWLRAQRDRSPVE